MALASVALVVAAVTGPAVAEVPSEPAGAQIQAVESGCVDGVTERNGIVCALPSILEDSSQLRDLLPGDAAIELEAGDASCWLRALFGDDGFDFGALDLESDDAGFDVSADQAKLQCG